MARCTELLEAKRHPGNMTVSIFWKCNSILTWRDFFMVRVVFSIPNWFSHEARFILSHKYKLMFTPQPGIVFSTHIRAESNLLRNNLITPQ
jgi:hypothetical protein